MITEVVASVAETAAEAEVAVSEITETAVGIECLDVSTAEHITKLANEQVFSPEEDFNKMEPLNELNDLFSPEQLEQIEEQIEKYVTDLKEKSEFPDTISNHPFNSSDLKKLSPEENAKMRESFYDEKASLKDKWAQLHNQPWPKYEHDVYSSNGKIIRHAGDDYDAHHVQPLGMGGKNEVTNITPMHAEVHYDKQGIHSIESPYCKLDKMIGG